MIIVFIIKELSNFLPKRSVFYRLLIYSKIFTLHPPKEKRLDFFITSAFWSVISIWFWAVIMPGADMFLIMRSAISQGQKCAYFSAIGIIIGTLIWLIVGFFFVKVLSQTSFFEIVQILGGCYLIYMAWQIFLSFQKKHSLIQDTKEQIYQNHWKNLAQGILTNLSNPKPPIFVSIILSKLPQTLSLEASITLLVLMTLIPSIWFFCVIKVFTIQRFFKIFMHYSKWIDLVVMGIFGFFGISLVIDGASTLWRKA